MFESGREDIIEFCLRYMISKSAFSVLAGELNLSLSRTVLNANAARRAMLLKDVKEVTVTLDCLRTFCRRNWQPPNKELHVTNLKSGLLRGHNWHGTAPSRLHQGLQNKVRECADGRLGLDEFLKIGGDIAKQEYFIVATHDLIETAIIEGFHSVIPSIATRGISDFIFQEVPYDLKHTGLPGEWTFERARKDRLAFAKSLSQRADTERIRQQAEGSINDWGFNRFYVVVRDLENWLINPKGVLAATVGATEKLGKPLTFQIDPVTIKCQVVFVE